jgi:hypothetical protein
MMKRSVAGLVDADLLRGYAHSVGVKLTEQCYWQYCHYCLNQLMVPLKLLLTLDQVQPNNEFAHHCQCLCIQHIMANARKDKHSRSIHIVVAAECIGEYKPQTRSEMSTHHDPFLISCTCSFEL